MLAAKVSQTGLPPTLVRKRLVPRQLWQSDSWTEANNQRAVNLAVERIGRVFSWTPQQMLQDEVLDLEPALGGVRFKVAANANQRLVSAYTVYAHYLSWLSCRLAADNRPGPCP